MPETPNRKYPYPAAAGVAPAVPQYMQLMGDAIDLDVKGIDNRVKAVEARPLVKRGLFTGATDASGLVSFLHGLGVKPASVHITPASTGTDLNTRITDYTIHDITTSGVFVRVVRRDTNAWAAAGLPAAFYWTVTA